MITGIYEFSCVEGEQAFYENMRVGCEVVAKEEGRIIYVVNR